MGILGKWFGGRTPETPPPAPPVDPAVVTAELVEAARAHGVTGQLRVEGNYLFIDDGDGVVRHIFLGNLVQEYGALPAAERPALLAKYARIAVRPVRVAKPDLSTRVLPKLQPRREREAMRMRFGEGVKVSGLLAGRPIAGGELVLELAVDEPETIRLLSQSDLAGVKLDEAEAHARAVENLAARSKGPWKELAPGLFRSPWADCWDGARLALPALFRELPVRGTPIVVIPNRNTVLVTGSDETDALPLLYPAARALMDEDRALHLSPLWLDGNGWRGLDVERDAAAIAASPSLMFLSSLQTMLDLQACAEGVRKRLATRGFTVGEWGALAGEGLPLMTAVPFPAGKRVALPHTDMVVFDGGTSLVAWYKLEAILGDDLAPLDVWPPHFEVRRALTADEIARACTRAAR